MVSPTCWDADVDVGQRGQVASPGEESIGHLNKNKDEETLNRKIRLNKDQIKSLRITESTTLHCSFVSQFSCHCATHDYVLFSCYVLTHQRENPE